LLKNRIKLSLIIKKPSDYSGGFFYAGCQKKQVLVDVPVNSAGQDTGF